MTLKLLPAQTALTITILKAHVAALEEFERYHASNFNKEEHQRIHQEKMAVALVISNLEEALLAH